MKLEALLTIISSEPVFSSGLLLTLGQDPADVRKQLSRWTKAGKIIQLRRGLYTLAEPYRKVSPEPFLIANRLHRPSYVSLQSALAHHRLIPEWVPVVTSITTSRPGEMDTPLGRFIYRHCKRPLFFGFQEVDLGKDQAAFVATPEKALLDLIYFTPGGERQGFLTELRLQNLDTLDLELLGQMARDSKRPKLLRAVLQVAKLAADEEYDKL
jgi:predicted transcriptional regulator of viral defense system